MDAKWTFSRYQQNPLAKIWACYECGIGCECVTSCRETPKYCADRLKKQRIDNIKREVRREKKS